MPDLPLNSDDCSGTRERLARGLVRWCSRWWQASYVAYTRAERGDVPGWWHTPWSAGAKRMDKFVLPLATRLDRRNAAEQMAQEGWWG